MNRLVAASIALGVAVIAVVAIWIIVRQDDEDTHRVARGSIDVTIQTIGRVQSGTSTIIRTPVSGEVDIVAVVPGDDVQQGDIVVQLVREPFDRAVSDAERQLEQAEFALQQAQAEADENPDDQAVQFALVQAAQRVEAAELALSDAETARIDAHIRAPADGVVLEVPVQTGSLVNRSAPVVVTYDRDGLEVVANVDELDLVNVEIGAEARMRLDAFPDQEVTGTVESTAPAAQEQGGATIFPTTISLTVPDDLDIRPGMNADVTIVTEARDDVLLIPQQYIRSVGNRAFVQVLVDGEQVEREVTLGYRSAGQAEVVSGLEEGDVIVQP